MNSRCTTGQGQPEDGRDNWRGGIAALDASWEGTSLPGEFIPVAEDSGLILPIGKRVLREACRQARAWMDAHLLPMTIAVNISALEFRSEQFLEGVFEILAETGLDPKFLELELTKSVLMKRVEATGSILKTQR